MYLGGGLLCVQDCCMYKCYKGVLFFKIIQVYGGGGGGLQIWGGVEKHSYLFKKRKLSLFKTNPFLEQIQS